MAQTRSNKVFSPYTIHMHCGAKSKFELEHALLSAVQREANDEEMVDINDIEGIFDAPVAPDVTKTTLNPPPSLGSDILTPVSTESHFTGNLMGDETNSKKRRLRAKKEQSRAQRKRMRTLATKDDSATPSYADSIRPNISARYSNEGPRVQCCTSEPTATSTGFVGLNGKKDPQATREYTLAEVTGPGSELNFELKKWDGSTPTVIADQHGRIIAVLAGWPNDSNWSAVQTEAAAALEACRPQCIFTQEQLTNRRGQFHALNCGVSFGGGQQRPMNLKNNKVNKGILEGLCGMECFKRIASFGSGVMKNRAPKIYNAYVDNLAALHDQEAREQKDDGDKGKNTLKRPFPSSIFSASTFNMGPRTVCLKHADFGNLAFGWCAVTALGSFDYQSGGHLILWDCALVIEFPPGATILLPSAVLSHSNVAIGPEERRYSFTQYTAGGLFRWVANKFQTATKYEAQLTKEQREQRVKDDMERWSLGLALWPTVNLEKTDLTT